MRVPLTTRDFLDRAELVYGDRVGVVDEPAQPAPSLGEVTYREVARRGRAFAAALDALGVGEGERVAVVSHNAARMLELLLSVPSHGTNRAANLPLFLQRASEVLPATRRWA